jgi:hypothetical protein
MIVSSSPSSPQCSEVPEPRSLAVADSFLNSFAADPAPATFSTTAGAMAITVRSGLKLPYKLKKR